MALTIQNVSKRFNSFQVLSDVSFSMETGEIVSILGPSGCGKSTLLQMVAGLQSPDTGEIFLDDQLLSSSSYVMPPEKRPINMVFQDYALWPHMTVMQNIFYGEKLKKTKKEIIQEKKDFLFQLLKLNGLEDRYPAQLSGGQQQRVAIARALSTEPKLLLMDEPLSNLDMQLRYEMRNELSYLLRRLGTTVLHVTHDPLEAYSLADRILILRDGQIEQFGNPKEVHEQPASLWVAGLLGMSNRISGTAMQVQSNSEQQVQVGKSQIIGKGNVKPGSKVVVTMEPENIHVSSKMDPQVPEKINCLTGKVVHTIYEGSRWRLIVETDGGKVTLLHQEPIPTKTVIGLSFSIKDTHIFAIE